MNSSALLSKYFGAELSGRTQISVFVNVAEEILRVCGSAAGILNGTLAEGRGRKII